MLTPIVNNEERIRQIRLRSTNPSSKGQTLDQGKVIELPPGVTLVDTDTWNQAKSENEMVRKLLVTEIEASPIRGLSIDRIGRSILEEGKPLADKRPLKALASEAAIKLIREALDTSMLRAWLADESREDVRKMIEKQIQSIEKPGDAARDAKLARAGKRKAAE